MVKLRSYMLDIHTHRPAPYPEALVSLSPVNFKPEENQYYSVGIHPWNTIGSFPDEEMARLGEIACRSEVKAIGECGVDTLRGAPAFRQLQVFGKHVEISEKVGKPLIVHDVKAHDIILGCRRDLSPTMPWAIHGFRGKPQVARMLLKGGLWLSFGEKFNLESLSLALDEAPDRILAETDESMLGIEDIIASLGEAAGADLLPLIRVNTSSFLNL